MKGLGKIKPNKPGLWKYNEKDKVLATLTKNALNRADGGKGFRQRTPSICSKGFAAVASSV